MTNEEIAVKLTQHTDEIASLKRRIGNCEEQQTILHKLVNSVDRLAVNMEYMAKEQAEQGDRLKRLEQEPVDTYKHYKRLAIGCVITGVIGAVLGALLSLLF